MDSQGNRVKTVPPTEVEGRPPSPSVKLRSVPPLDPTAPMSVSRIPVRPSSVSGLRPIAKPILASECLKDDIAPLEPFPRLSRAVLGVAGVASIAGAAMMLKQFPTIAIGAFVGGALAAVAGALPSYRLRGAVGALGALVVAGALVSGEPSWALRALASIALASVLFTRACYRAKAGVRVALAVCVALFVAGAATSTSRLGGGVMAGVAICALLGLMGEQTTGGAAWWAGLALLATGVSIGIATPIALVPLAAVATLLVATVAASFSLFTLAAAVIAPTERARAHRAALPSPSNDQE